MNRFLTSVLGMALVAGMLYRPAASNLGSMPLGKSGAISAAKNARSPITSKGIPGSASPIRTWPIVGITPGGKNGINPCADPSDPISTISGFFGPDFANGFAPSQASAKILSAKLKEVNQNYELRYLTVTLPDPVHTDLELFFDRTIGAISLAAAESDFNFDRYWLPWPSAALPQQLECDWSSLQNLATNEQMKQPGLLLFRKPQKGAQKPQLLLIFLVAESPTSGINEIQFLSALNYIQVLSTTPASLPKKKTGGVSGNQTADVGQPAEPEPDSRTIDVLGPTFSGSVDSFIRVVKEASSTKPKLKFRIVSGSATNAPALQRLHDVLCCGEDSDAICRIGSTLSDDIFALNQFISFLKNHGHTGGDIAIISEDGTEYGDIDSNGFKSGTDGPVFLHFPRKMARLRDAYQANPQSNTLGTSANEPLPRRLLPLVLNENPLSGEDEVPAYSKEHTPIAQEAEVLAMANVLRERKVKYAGILATDPLDTMFLIRFLHQVAPDVRPFVVDADLLYLRALDDDTAPIGLMAVTSYPVLPATQGWRRHRPEGGHPLVFTGSYAESIYNACLLLLRRDPVKTPLTDDPTTNLRDAELTPPNPRVKYLSPELSLDPPLWLMVAGHNGYWPVEILTFDEGPIDLQYKGYLLKLTGEKLPREWLIVWGMFTCFAAFHAILGLYPSLSNLHWLENFKIAGKQGSRRAGYLLVGTLAVSYIEFTLLKVPGDQSVAEPRAIQITASFVLGFLATAVLRLTAVLCNQWTLRLETKFHRLPKLSRIWNEDYSIAVVAALITLLCYLLMPWRLGNAGANQYESFLWYRSIHLTSGASPVVPFCLLMAGLYLWAWTQLACQTTADRQPYLWRSTFLWPFFEAGRNLGQNMRALIYDKRRAGLVGCLMALTFVITIFQYNYFSSVDGLQFDYVYGPILACLFSLIIYNLAKLLVIWSDFKKVLEGFDQLPLRGAFRRLPRYYSWSPIWEHGGTRQSYDVMMRWFNNLENLASVTNDPTLLKKYKESWRNIKIIARRSTLRRKDWRGNCGAGEVKTGLLTCQMRENMLKCTSYVERRYLRSEWVRGASDSLDKERQAALTQESKDQEFKTQERRILAEESVALYYLRYIRGVCLYMRHILFFISASFILAVISLKSYPFQSPRLISLWLTLVFSVLGIGIIKVFIEMEKDAVLSCLSNTEVGKLSPDFFLRLISYGALPLFTFIAAQFPSVARFFFSWVQPGLQAIK